MVHLKNVDCLDISYEFDCNGKIVSSSACNQNNKTSVGLKMTSLTNY
jgi:hypothetical protein